MLDRSGPKSDDFDRRADLYLLLRLAAVSQVSCSHVENKVCKLMSTDLVIVVNIRNCRDMSR